MTKKLYLGLVLESSRVSKYVVQFVTRCQQTEGLEISNIFLLGSGSVRDTASKTISHFCFKAIIALEKLLLLKNRHHCDHPQSYDISAALPTIAIQQLSNEANLAPVHKLDLIVSFSPRNFTQRVAAVSRLGAITVSFSGEFTDRSGPSGFWEVYFRRDSTDFAIEHIARNSMSAASLLRGRVGTQFYYLLNQANLWEKSYYYLYKTVEKIASTGQIPYPQPDWPVSRIPLNLPSIAQQISYLGGLGRLLVSKVAERLRGYRLDWNVAFVCADWRVVDLWRATVIQNPAGRYMADPFVISKQDRHCCFVEDYDNAAKRGRISVYELGTQWCDLDWGCAGGELSSFVPLPFPLRRRTLYVPGNERKARSSGVQLP